jgi:hypothetical protein
MRRQRLAPPSRSSGRDGIFSGRYTKLARAWRLASSSWARHGDADVPIHGMHGSAAGRRVLPAAGGRDRAPSDVRERLELGLDVRDGLFLREPMEVRPYRLREASRVSLGRIPRDVDIGRRDLRRSRRLRARRPTRRGQQEKGHEHSSHSSRPRPRHLRRIAVVRRGSRRRRSGLESRPCQRHRPQPRRARESSSAILRLRATSR